MNANKSGRLNQAHDIPTLTVAPVTRAVRAALAISLTLLALGGSSAAFAAGTCELATPATTSCDGAFIGTAQHPRFAPIDDLAVIQDHLVPHSVTPAAGLMGIDAHWGGNVGATHADITTAGADELFAHSPSVATAGSARGTITHAPMSGAQSLGTAAYGDVSYINNGPINAYGTGAYDVTAVNSYSAVGSDTVDNQSAGTINAVAQDGNAIAVNSSGYVNATVTNEGAITSSSVNGVAVGVIAQAYTGSASVTNSGSITATSTGYQAVGILASSNAGYASVINSGSVTATGGQDQAVGIEAFGQTGSNVYNTGSVTATSATGTAIGILAQTVNGNASITNTNGITVTAGYNAVGLSAITANGDASATSSGFMEVIGHGGLTSLIEAYSAVGNANASNSGFVISGSYGGSAVGVSATSGDGNATASNTAAGYLRVVTPGGATSYATGISAKTYNGDATASNDGTVYASSTLGVSIGINVNATGGNATATNTGTIEASNSLFNNVRGIQAISSTGQATVTNSGEILATSNQILGYPFAVTTVDGVGAQGYAGSTVTNSGYIKAVGPWFVNGVEGISLYGSAAVTNTSTGKIDAIGLQPTGIEASVGYGQGQAVVNNAGSIIVNQEGDCHCSGPNLTQYGAGISVSSDYAEGVQVTNSGSISVNTQHGGWGILAHTYNNVASVTNTGSIALATTGYGTQNFGISASSAYGNTSVVNSGDITITTGAIPNVYHPENIAIGIFAETGRHHDVGFGAGYYGAGNTSVTNTGNISIVNAVKGYGIHAVAEYGSALVSNSGHITMNDSAIAWGIFASTDSYSGSPAGTGDVVDNSGVITITAPVDARGIEALSLNTSGATITNMGDIAVNAAGGSAYGVFVRNYTYGDTSGLTVNNGGTISANNVAGSAYFNGIFRGAQADGIRMFSYGNDTIVNNTGSITASMSESFAAGSAIGILVKNGYGSHYGAISITNSGSIAASALSNNSTSSFHAYYAHGAFAGGVVVAATYGDVAVANAGSINATATGAYNAGAGLTTADGISVISKVGNSATNGFNLGNITLTNVANGSIAASAESTEGTGAAVANSIAGVVSFGSQGAYLVSHGDGITVNNAGLLSATALVDATAQGSASAFGISAINGSAAGFVNVRNTGGIYATAMSPGVATATGITTTANDITVALGKTSFIVATANGPDSVATGLFASGANVSASNSGTLVGIATGADSTAYGVDLISPGALSFTNTGAIHANAAHAVTVDLTSATSATLINTGLIVARPTVLNTNGIAVETSAPNAVLQNYGTITGKLRNGAGNFTFTNFAGGIWNAAGISTFGAGDDFLRNVGTIHLNGSTIDLGAPDTLGNRFTNATGGTITVTGNNSISMGTASATVFGNNGTLNFQNGVAGDTLTIDGNFSGNSNGVIDMDVDGLHGTGDKLNIEGNVLAGSVNTVNVDLLTDPTATTTLVPLITVSGTAAANAFVLGKVVQNKSFLDVLVSKPGVYSLSLTNPTAAASPSGSLTQPTSLGVVQAASFASRPALGFEESVTGLSDLGTLAASAAPGVQSLMNSQVGTLEDRMGAVSQTIKGGFSVWTRAFADSGTVDPGHSAGNFGQNGNFGFDQSNSGAELGLDFALTDEVKAGALFAKSQANQSLDGSMGDSSKITGNTAGVYGTWIAPSGFYLDASYRWMSFNDRLHAPTGYALIHGDADAFNLELGKTWTLQNGLQIAPQFQYTLTKVNNINSLGGSLAGFQSNGDNASRARLGVMFSKNYTPATSTAVWTPYASVSAVQELDGKNSYSVNNTFFGETHTQGTSVLAETGVNVQFGKLAVFGGVNWQDGGALKSFFGGQLGLRYTF